MKRFIKTLFLLSLLLSCSLCTASTGVLEVEGSTQLKNEVVLPVMAHNVPGLTQGRFEIAAPITGNIVFNTFTFTDNIVGFTSLQNNLLKLDFVVQNAKDFQDETSITLGYATYSILETAPITTSLTVNPLRINFVNSMGQTIEMTPLAGIIEKNYLPGDALGEDRVTPRSVVSVLRHLNSIELITNAYAISAVTFGRGGPIQTADALAILKLLASTYDTPLVDAPQPPTSYVEGILPLSDIHVALGTSRDKVPLPQSVSVLLTDGKTTMKSVKWDGGAPTYNGEKKGTYVFFGIVSGTHLVAKVNVSVQDFSITVSVADAAFGKSVMVQAQYPGAGRYRIRHGVTNELLTTIQDLGKSTTIFPVPPTGTPIIIELLDALNTVMHSHKKIF